MTCKLLECDIQACILTLLSNHEQLLRLKFWIRLSESMIQGKNRSVGWDGMEDGGVEWEGIG